MQEFRVNTDHYFHRPLKFSPDGRYLFVEARPFARIDTTDGTVHELPEVVNLGPPFALFRGGHAIVFSNGGLFADDATTGERSWRPPPWPGVLRAFASDPRAETLFVSDYDSGAHTSTLTALADDLSDRAKLMTVDDRIEYLVVSADGRCLAGRSPTNVFVWNIEERREVMRTPWKGQTFTFAISCDGARLATATNRSLALWDTATGKELFRNGRAGAKMNVAVSHPAHPILATCGETGIVLFWDHTGRVLTQFDWGLRGVRGLTFSPDGLRCAAVDANGKVIVWDVDL